MSAALKIEWRRKLYPATARCAGWELWLDGLYAGSVWLNGDWVYRDAEGVACSQPLAAQALLRAAGVSR